MIEEYFIRKLICIETASNNFVQINIGESYICNGHPKSIFVSVSKKDKYYGVFEKKLFISPAEWREQQINEVLND